jgi:hypothetical protein
MSAPARSAQWTREALAGRLVWQPLGVVLSLWAWFGWLTPWFAALLPQRSEGQAPHVAVFVMCAALLGYASAAMVNRMNLPGLMAAAGRLLVLLAVLGAAWRAYIGFPTMDSGPPWQAIWVVVLGLGHARGRAGRLSPGDVLEPESTLRQLFTGTLLTAAAIVLFPQASGAAGAGFLPLYVGGGLAGVVLGQISDASRHRGGRPLPFGLSWHAGLLLGVAAVIACWAQEWAGCCPAALRGAWREQPRDCWQVRRAGSERFWPLSSKQSSVSWGPSLTRSFTCCSRGWMARLK